MAAVSFSSLPPLSSIFSMYASISAFIMMLQTILNQLIPSHLQNYLLDVIRRYYYSPRPTNATIVIEEHDTMTTNEVYSATETYLSSLGADLQRLKITKSLKDPTLTVRFTGSDKIADSYDGVDLEWRFVDEEEQRGSDNANHGWSEKKKYFELTFEKKFRDKVLNSYIPLVLQKAKMIEAEKKVLKLNTASSYGSNSINLEHPFTFQTLAMEPKLKEEIMKDLDRFIQRKDFYRRVGRAWKRGYLLYGPPGTGKSSLIAAMANYLKFDIYDLELASVRSDSDLRKLMLRTPNRSILVVEDIDCTVELPGRKARSRPTDNQFTLSGMLNFIDGLWSSCGDERIIVFTTNHKEKLDPALLRPGRMDMHIHMSYLTPDGFKLLASAYLNILGNDPRLSEIENLIKGKNVTPAEVAEELMRSEDIDTCLDRLVDILENKKNKDDDNVIPSEVADDLMRSNDDDNVTPSEVAENDDDDDDDDHQRDNYRDDDHSGWC